MSTDFADLRHRFNLTLSRLRQKQGEAAYLRKTAADLQAEIASLSADITLLGKVLAAYNQLAESVQERFLRGIESLVTDGLMAVFGEEIRFKITPSTRAKTVTLDFTIQDVDGGETDLLDARGGGLVAVCGVILRIIMVRLLRDKLRQILFLDEPFAHLSDKYVEVAAQVIHDLAERLDVQVVLVTHQPAFMDYADAVYELRAGGGKASVKRIGEDEGSSAA